MSELQRGLGARNTVFESVLYQSPESESLDSNWFPARVSPQSHLKSKLVAKPTLTPEHSRQPSYTLQYRVAPQTLLFQVLRHYF
jgi:hypothetical protein